MNVGIIFLFRDQTNYISEHGRDSTDDLSGIGGRSATRGRRPGGISEVSNYELFVFVFVYYSNWRIMPWVRRSGQACKGNEQVMEALAAPKLANGVHLGRTHTHTHLHAFRCTHQAPNKMSQKLIANVLLLITGLCDFRGQKATRSWVNEVSGASESPSGSFRLGAALGTIHPWYGVKRFGK